MYMCLFFSFFLRTCVSNDLQVVPPYLHLSFDLGFVLPTHILALSIELLFHNCSVSVVLTGVRLTPIFSCSSNPFAYYF